MNRSAGVHSFIVLQPLLHSHRWFAPLTHCLPWWSPRVLTHNKVSPQKFRSEAPSKNKSDFTDPSQVLSSVFIEFWSV